MKRTASAPGNPSTSHGNRDCRGKLRMTTRISHRSASAPGKIILTGEFAVVFGYPGIAVPSPLTMNVEIHDTRERCSFSNIRSKHDAEPGVVRRNGRSRVTLENQKDTKDLRIHWSEIAQKPEWQEYLKHIIARCGKCSGDLTIENNIPLQKGMGSSTALVIAVSRCLLGKDCREKALEIEDELNPGHSGLDFSVIWNNSPTLFQKDNQPETIKLPRNLLRNTMLIDTGAPNETTPELIAWITERREELEPALRTIGRCTEKLREGEDLGNVMREHHRAQVALGVVPESVQKLVEKIESSGGSAKIIGAGGRTGGGGMLLVLHEDRKKILRAVPTHFSILNV
ncbi:hypothetical protein A2454_05010 [Candidatus Peribacteria bacterium RIFOXYC2_FULL_55_14]|nr:MAG: mevalonate kinase [Candidatus Peribacteria bacterium GW2011_GWB1_54_5]KKW39988.1 MAG: mevalonate kinase [Candidatus Peribacteria bacterium GW2011_GWC2_54_8]KKW41440.1 MAG: mevalonate kinase [Candidatus Peregrinibacteria bacterium GW2011_GWA2_54_9]OGJ72559.1 MAG: hypothetical protein A2198_01935 [Candidatus Peribacteria bacterium RIFOXYA1_FULL_56_14]OGJ73682.1 MAG: hypothetical protein A2217_06175 [Candidatus Peribacteria bacterium RIFOXYA2_FULL_55_28]OGJ75293.1 MAG: hypothetical protei